jgi:hypothetical protein
VNEFIGIQALKELQANQVELFRTWAKGGHWEAFHANHYDWWTFPIDAPSSFGFKYTLDEISINELSKDEEFLASLRKASELLLSSWGWDPTKNQKLQHPAKGQAWANWPIRLAKANQSLVLFKQDDLVESTRALARELKAQGHSFEYSGRDLLPEILG